MMYCPECRETGRMPWQHADGCVEALRQKLRWYAAGLPIIIALLALETLAVAYVFIRLARCT
jgi:hypothetical protein